MRITREEHSGSGKTEAGGVAVEPVSRAKAAAEADAFHAVQFFSDSDALCRIVGNFIGEGLDQGAMAVLFVTPDHAARIESCLRARAIDVDALKRLGTFMAFDARATLELLMVDGMPNRSEFRRTV
jgi:superfamily I DNA/RNA helicase